MEALLLEAITSAALSVLGPTKRRLVLGHLDVEDAMETMSPICAPSKPEADSLVSDVRPCEQTGPESPHR